MSWNDHPVGAIRGLLAFGGVSGIAGALTRTEVLTLISVISTAGAGLLWWGLGYWQKLQAVRIEVFKQWDEAQRQSFTEQMDDLKAELKRRTESDAINTRRLEELNRQYLELIRQNGILTAQITALIGQQRLLPEAVRQAVIGQSGSGDVVPTAARDQDDNI
jgi:hypothetical protein